MKTEVLGSSAFSYIQVTLEPGETIIAESDAMVSMDADLDMDAKFNGGFFKGLARKFFGGESLFINHFTNNTDGPRRLVLVQGTPGQLIKHEMTGGEICLQPGAYVACTPDVKVGVRWAGFKSFLAGEGLFKLFVSGTGTLFFGAYGGLVEKEIDGEYIIDNSHLVAYDPSMKLKLQLAGGIFSSFFSGEGYVTRIEGKGKVILQSRSISGLAGWLNPKL